MPTDFKRRCGRYRRCRLRSLFVIASLVCVATSVPAQTQTRADYLRRFDRDGDGRVSLREYQDYMSRGFRALDRNSDGVLSPHELPRGTQRRAVITLDAHLRALARTFDLLDVNNDGYLDARELTAPPP